MKDYVSFECTHFEEADPSGQDERHALAYADIDGHPADENAEGMVICRVWLLKGKDGIYPKYLVDWHHNGYRMNESVLELVKTAKKNLETFHENILENLFRKAYQRYKVLWMYEHHCTLEELVTGLQEQMDNGSETVSKAFQDFQADSGFHSELWVCEDEFRINEWKDECWARKLLHGNEYSLWLTR